MSASPKAKRISHAAAYCAILALGLGLRVWNLDQRSVWHDEGHSLAFIRVPLGQMNTVLAYDDHPPLYYYCLRLWMSGGGSVAWGRLLSALCSAAALPLAYSLARTFTGRRTALGAMALLAISPQAIYYGQELRMYALQSLFVAAMMACGAAHARKPKPWRLAGAILFGVLACYTHYLSALFLIGLLCALPWIPGRAAEPAGRRWARAAVATLVCALLYWPWLSTAFAHLLANSMGGLKAAAPSANPNADFYELIRQSTLGFKPVFPFDTRAEPSISTLIWIRKTTASVCSVLLLGLFALGLAGLRPRRGARIFFAAFLAAPILLAAVYQMAGGRFYPRFAVPLAPLVFACAAHGIARIPRSLSRATIAALIAAPMLASSMAMLKTDLRDVSREAAAALDQARAEYQGQPPADAPVLHAGTHSFWNLMGYDPTPGRHRFLAGPHVPALARLMYGPQVSVGAEEFKTLDCVWIAYSEWGPGPMQLRRKTETTWLAEGWRLSILLKAQPHYNKKMEIALYERID